MSPSPFATGPALSEADEQSAWALFTGEATDDELSQLLERASEEPAVGVALEALAEDALMLRCLGDAELRAHLAGPGLEGLEGTAPLQRNAADTDGLDADELDADELDAAELDAAELDVDELLDGAIAELRTRSSRWEAFRAFGRQRRGLLGTALALAAALLLFVQLPPAPAYSSSWQNGAAQVRGEPAPVGSYEVSNVAKLVVRPGEGGGFAHPQLKVYTAPRGEPLREAPQFRAQQGTTGAIRISLPITEAMAPGPHTVVVLLGDNLTWASPDLPAWWWTRIETELEVLNSP